MVLGASLLLLGFFFIPSLFYLWLVRTGRRLGLAVLGVMLIFLALLPAAGGSIGFAFLYVLVGSLAIRRSLLQLPGVDYGLRWSSWSQAAGGVCAGLSLAVVYLALNNGGALFAGSSLIASVALLPMQVLVSFVPAIWEEFYFRGIVQTELREKTKHALVAIVVTATLFALFHSEKILHVIASNSAANGYWYAAFLLLGGITMGWLKERFGLLPAILCHGCYNLIV